MTIEEAERMLREFNAPQAEFTQKLKFRAFKRDDYCCRFCLLIRDTEVAAQEAHHWIGRRMGGDKRKNVLWNLISTCCHHHRLVERKQILILEWDGSTKHGVLVVQQGEKIYGSE